MGAIIIEAKDAAELKFIKAFLERTQIKNKILDKEEYEDFMLGSLMNKSKTGKRVSKATIVSKLKK